MSKKPIVYADLNCPFCFVLHERLKLLDLESQIDWHIVEHAPAANTQELKNIELLNTEFKAALDKATDVVIHNPNFVVNTTVANEILSAVSISFPEKEFEFRDALYRAFWHEGLDISDPSVIEELLVKHGVSEFEFSQESQTQLNICQSSWESGGYDFKVPVMINSEGSSLIGVQSQSTILSFFENQHITKADDKSACHLKANDKVLLLGSSISSQVLSEYLMIGDYQVSKFETDKLFFDTVLSQESTLILIEYELDPNFELCKQLKSTLTSNTPIIYFSSAVCDEVEAQGFHSGITDMLNISRQRDSLLGRLNTHVRIKNQLDIISSYATHDALTGFYNRREIERVLNRSWQTACRYSTEITLFLIDVDNLKRYNLKYGYAAGDEALISISNILSRARSEDIVGRFSGEEFVMILHNTPEKELLKIAHRIQQNVLSREICYAQNNEEDYVSVSVGIATTLADKKHNYTDLLALAVKALEKAEALGKNQALKLRLN